MITINQDSSKKTKKIVLETGLALEMNPQHKKEQEDCCIIHEKYLGDENKLLLILLDGHGGAKVANLSLEQFPALFSKKLEKNSGNVEASFIEAFDELDEQSKEFEEEGSTAVFIYMCIENNERIIYSSNAGDSRSILVREGEAIRLSYDHKASDKEEIKRVKTAGGLFFRGRIGGTLMVTRSIGDYGFKKDGGGLICTPTTIREKVLDNDQYLMIGSDGIWDVITELGAYNIIKENKNMTTQQLAEHFCKRAVELGSKDNISCCLAKLN